MITFIRHALMCWAQQKLLEAAEAKGKKLILCGKQTRILEGASSLSWSCQCFIRIVPLISTQQQLLGDGLSDRTGHSLGGGVAELCALDLLHAAKPGRLPNIQAIGFASPAIGNQALASFVQQRGWKKFLTSYLLPGGLSPFHPTAAHLFYLHHCRCDVKLPCYICPAGHDPTHHSPLHIQEGYCSLSHSSSSSPL